MKSSLFCLFFVALCGFYSSSTTFAQTPDTTSAWRYLPLEVGNVWEYGSWIEECLGIEICWTRLVGYERWEAEGEWTVADTTYVVLRTRGYTVDGEEGGSGHIVVRFDTTEAHGVLRYPDGTEVGWPDGFACRLDAPFSAEVDCGDQGVGGVFVYEPREIEVRVEGETQTRIRKTYQSLIPGWDFVADVGLLYAGGSEFGGAWISLIYAKVGKVEAGVERFPVAAEPAAPDGRSPALAVYPNPTRGAVTVNLTLDRPQRVALTVLDVLGRRVLTSDLGVQAAGEESHRLDAASLPAGIYVVRLTGDAGATATARIVRQ